MAKMIMLSPPLKERIFRSSSLPPSNPLLLPTLGRPKTYKSWNEDKLRQACMEVQHGQSVRRAAETYGVPKSTLQDRVSGRVPFGAKSGPPSYLTEEEEDELDSFLTSCASLGYARSKQQVIALVQATVTAKGLGKTVSDGWWRSFLRRHGNITLRTAEPLAYARAVCSEPGILGHYYDLLEQTLKEHGILDKPSQIFNLDETGMPLDPTPPKVVTLKGTKHATSVTTGDKAQITVLGCCSASGYVIPPLVVFDRKTLKPEMTVGEVPGTMYGLSKNGWMDAELFELWFKHHFLAHAPPTRPLLLIMDGHSTHFQPSVVRMAAKEEVILFCLPPHSTHLTQPLDKGCFGPLKLAWKGVCKEYLTNNPGKVVTRFQFSELFGKAWVRSMTMTNIIAGFRTTGIYPFNRHALLPVPPTPSKFNPSALCKGTKLKFIPLYSPAKKVLVQSPSPTCSSPTFTEEEVTCFQRRHDEGYDLQHDGRYNLWLQMFHPKNELPVQDPTEELHFSDTTSSVSPATHTPPPQQSALKHSTVLSKLLTSQEPVIKVPKRQVKSSARVLTSTENLMNIAEKERKKKEEQQKKEERRAERERKREQKKLAGAKRKRVPATCETSSQGSIGAAQKPPSGLRELKKPSTAKTGSKARGSRLTHPSSTVAEFSTGQQSAENSNKSNLDKEERVRAVGRGRGHGAKGRTAKSQAGGTLLKSKSIISLQSAENSDEGHSDTAGEKEGAVSQGEFTVKELELFERRYENGYDLTHDMQYNLWLAVFHPDAVKGGYMSQSSTGQQSEEVFDEGNSVTGEREVHVAVGRGSAFVPLARQREHRAKGGMAKSQAGGILLRSKSSTSLQSAEDSDKGHLDTGEREGAVGRESGREHRAKGRTAKSLARSTLLNSNSSSSSCQKSAGDCLGERTGAMGRGSTLVSLTRQRGHRAKCGTAKALAGHTLLKSKSSTSLQSAEDSDEAGLDTRERERAVGRGRGCRAKGGSTKSLAGGTSLASTYQKSTEDSEEDHSYTGEREGAVGKGSALVSLARQRGRRAKGGRGKSQVGGTFLSSTCQNTIEDTDDGHSDMGEREGAVGRGSALVSLTRESRCRAKGRTAKSQAGGTLLKSSISLQSAEDSDDGSSDAGTECIMGFCDHPRARNWVQCDRCSRWYHCTCVDVSAAVA